MTISNIQCKSSSDISTLVVSLFWGIILECVDKFAPETVCNDKGNGTEYITRKTKTQFPNLKKITKMDRQPLG